MDPCSGLPLYGRGHLWVQDRLRGAQTPYMFGPVQLIGEDLTPTGTWLFPYKVTVVIGEGLKARHLVPGETYTRPGPQPTNLVTCDFTGATKEDGSFEVQITGVIQGH